MPGVVAPPAGLGGSAGEATPGGFGAATAAFNVNGMRNQSNNFLLDGTTNNDTFNTGFVLRPPPDAIQEFKLLTHSYSAEYGRNSGSVVNVVTKAGTNDLHGAAWEFNRDDALQARNFFAPATQPKPKLTQNQFGGSLGGPLLRDRLFGFGYYEGHRNTSGNTQNIVVLTDGQRVGNFGSTTIRDPQTGVAFPNNVIPQERLDPTASRLIDEFIPRANSAGNRYIVSPDTTDDRAQMGMRLDYQLTQNHSILARDLRSRTESIAPPTTRPDRQRRQGDAPGLHGVGYPRCEPQHDQRGAVRLQPHRRQPSGHQRAVEQRIRHQRAAKRCLSGWPGEHRGHRFLQHG